MNTTQVLLNALQNQLSVLQNQLAIAKNEYMEKQEQCDSLENAIIKLNVEIQNDIENDMKRDGFELKSFKSNHVLDLNYDDNNKCVYKVKTKNKLIEIQVGRSQYDTVYASGFKVVNRKGSKYQVEVYSDGKAHEFHISEKKFNTFISAVYRWENFEANTRKRAAEGRLQALKQELINQ